MLHLLRGLPTNIDGKPTDLETFRRLVRRWSAEPNTVFGSWTARRPRPEKIKELKGGSVYFVRKRTTIFRMPFLGIMPVPEFTPDADPKFANHVAICCAPKIVTVEAWPVGFLRGWRYLEADAAPPDLPDAGPRIPAELKELGLA